MANPVSATRPFAAFEWLLAGRYLRARRAERLVSVISMVSLIGIALGVATLIIAMAVMNGFRFELMTRILNINGHIIAQGYRGPMPDYAAATARIRAIPGVVRATPEVIGVVLANRGKANVGVTVRGITPDDLSAEKDIFEKYPVDALGDFASGDVIIGERLAQRLNLGPGDRVKLISPDGDVTPFGTLPRIKDYRIAGIFKVGVTLYDEGVVFMPLREAQAYFNTGDAANAIEINVDDPDRTFDLMPAIDNALNHSARLLPWQQTNLALTDNLELQRNVMALILALIILVAALNLISGLIMLVKDKSPDIAILRTIGMKRSAVMRVFFVAGASIGVTGTAIGLVIGILFCLNIENIRQFLSNLTGVKLFDPAIYFLSEMPARIEPDEVLFVAAVALGLSFLATLLPSWSAARLDPVEGLRYE